MAELFALNPEYSTTRLVTREVPTIEEPPDAAFETVLFLPEGEGRKGEGGLRTKGYFKRSLPDKPLITVITVVFNGAKHLEQAILSVIEQTHDNVEYIVIDGGSTDGTLDIIRKYEHAIDYWVSEKDGGIYDAMNKGLKLANGDYIGMLNSDDWLSTEAIGLISKHKHDSVDFVYSSVFITSKEGNVLYIKLPEDTETIPYRMPFPHQTFYAKASIFKKIYGYDTKYKLSADLDIVWRVIKAGFNGVQIQQPMAYFREGGASGGLITFIETRSIACKYGMGNIKSYFLLVESLLKVMAINLIHLRIINFIRNIFGSKKYIPYNRKEI
ncbi:glycosyltransferase family 2 protein [Candidatus Electronema halotolerans]